jgi:cysteine desulfurase family protein
VSQTIYFDNAATTFPKPEIVYETMDKVYRSIGVNAGRSSYRIAREANEIINETRTNLAKLVNFKTPNRIVFAPSATIAMNQIINGLKWDDRKTVYVTPFEHNAIMRPLHYIQKKHHIDIEIIQFDEKSFEIDMENLKINFSQKRPDYIFLSHVSNVTGYILPVELIAEVAKKYNAVIILDCAQSMGLLPIDTEKLDVDYLVFAGHKTLYGPFGIAGFIDKSDFKLSYFLAGGTGSDSLNLDMPDYYPTIYEVASPNIQAIAGLNAAIKWIDETGIDNIRIREEELTLRLTEGLSGIYGAKLYLPKKETDRTGIISCTFDDADSNEVGKLLDEYSIAVRTGYHCAPNIHNFLSTTAKGGTVRFSLSYFNTVEEIEYLINCLTDLDL